jgi:hypothetical protein
MQNYIFTECRITYLQKAELHVYRMQNYIFTECRIIFLQNAELHYYRINLSKFLSFCVWQQEKVRDVVRIVFVREILCGRTRSRRRTRS